MSANQIGTSVSSGPVNRSERIVSIDVLRGFAVLGILIMNIQSFSMIGAAYLNPYAYGDLTGANFGVWFLSHLLADSKFMTVFSLLFGAGVVLMVQRREASGRPTAGVHYRRMFWQVTMPYWPPGAIEKVGARWWMPPPEAVQAELVAYRGGWSQQQTLRGPTSVFMQTIICTAIFYGHGFGLYGSVSRVGQAFIVVAVWALLLAACPLWLQYFRFGPFEWLWRSLTYMKLQPLKAERSKT